MDKNDNPSFSGAEQTFVGAEANDRNNAATSLGAFGGDVRPKILSNRNTLGGNLNTEGALQHDYLSSCHKKVKIENSEEDVRPKNQSKCGMHRETFTDEGYSPNTQVKNEEMKGEKVGKSDSNQKPVKWVIVEKKPGHYHEVSGSDNDTLLEAMERHEEFAEQSWKHFLIPNYDKNMKKGMGIPNLGTPLHLLHENFYIFSSACSTKSDYRSDIPREHFTSVVSFPLHLVGYRNILKHDNDCIEKIAVLVKLGESLFESLSLDGRIRKEKLLKLKLRRWRNKVWVEMTPDMMLESLNCDDARLPYEIFDVKRKSIYNQEQMEKINMQSSANSSWKIQTTEVTDGDEPESDEKAANEERLSSVITPKQQRNSKYTVVFNQTIESVYMQLNKSKKRKASVEIMLKEIYKRRSELVNFSKETPDLIAGTVFNRINQYQPAVCCLLNGEDKIGTGFYIGEGRIMTNYHVKEILYPEARITFNYDIRAGQGDVSLEFQLESLEPLAFGKTEELDYAVLKLASGLNDLNKLPVVRGEDCKEFPKTGNMVHIIGWPTNAVERHIDPNCVTLNQNISGVEKDWFIMFNMKQYHCNMFHGSSGSLVVDYNGYPVLLHHRGYALDEVTCKEAYQSCEQGIWLSSIKNHMKVHFDINWS